MVLTDWRRSLFVSVLLLGDIALLALSFRLAHSARGLLPALGAPPPPSLAQLLPLLPLAVFCWGVIFVIAGLYTPPSGRLWADIFISVAVASGLALLLLLSLSYLLRDYRFPRLMLALLWAFATVALAGWRLLARTALRAAHRRGRGLRRLLLVGPSEAVGEVAQHLRSRREFGHSLRYMTLDGTLSGDRLREAAARDRLHEIVLVGVDFDRADVLDFVAVAGELRLAVRLLPPSLAPYGHRLQLDELAGQPSLCFRDLPAGPWERALKRTLDVALASVGLLLLLPLFTVIATAIKCDSTGPVFFGQLRAGKDGRSFRLYKFRSMRADAASSPPVKAQRNDARVTGVGRFLRRTSLDELPQLWNVLRGEMSLVGPRPETFLYVRRYSAWNRRRLQVKPGLTGLAQANGVRGNTSIDDKTSYDLDYINRQSLALDLSLIWRTLVTLPSHHEAY
jgi:exopolysaccharide biosynthesis polyprenyl glycosylphosphotransferase